MKFNKLTLRSLILSVFPYELEKVFEYINEKDCGNKTEDLPSIEQTEGSYRKVVDELLSKPLTTAYKHPIAVTIVKDWFDHHEYVDVCLFNLGFIKPPKGLKPWGCSGNRKAPKGCYNVNADKHQKYFAFGWIPWSKIIDTPIIIQGKAKKLSRHAILGEILWEMTFYGWTEKANENKNPH